MTFYLAYQRDSKNWIIFWAYNLKLAFCVQDLKTLLIIMIAIQLINI